MKVMSLNLHSYQEDNQHEKFRKIAKEIFERQIDVVCFCEAAQHIASPRHNDYVREDNAIKIINDYINEFGNYEYSYAWDFSHYGFRIYEEGIGILSRYPIKEITNRYVTNTHDSFNYMSRKIMKAKIDVDGKEMNIFSIHLGWDDECEPFAHQVSEIHEWIKEEPDVPTLLCGDFNNDSRTQGYKELMDRGFRDLYLEKNPDGDRDGTFINPTYWDGDQRYEVVRIDYSLTPTKELNAKEVYYLFVDDCVSDHVAIVTELE